MNSVRSTEGGALRRLIEQFKQRWGGHSRTVRLDTSLLLELETALAPLSGPVDASGEPRVLGYRAPITSAPYCLDCVRKHHPWSDTHDPPPVYDTHETCINCGTSLAAVVPSSPAQEWMAGLMCEAHKDYIIAPFDCPGCSHEANRP